MRGKAGGLVYFVIFFLLSAPAFSSEEGVKAYREARQYIHGDECVIDEKKAKALVLKAAELNEPKAKALKSFWIFSGEKGFVKNESQGVNEFQESKNALQKQRMEGDEEAAFVIAYGNLLMFRSEAEGLAPLRELAMRQNHEAYTALAWAYQTGQGTQKDLTQSYHWARKAAEKQNVQGMYLLGKSLLEGAGVKKDPKEALTWLQKAGKRGFPQAQNLLGELFCQGREVPADPVQSSEWLLLAAKQDLAQAERHLAQHYLEGKGVSIDSNEAKRWLMLAEAHGLRDDSGLKQRIEKAFEETSLATSGDEDVDEEIKKEFTGGDWLMVGAFDLPPGNPKEFFESFQLNEFPAEMTQGKEITFQAMTRVVRQVTAQPKGFSFDKIFGRRTNCFAMARLQVDAGRGGRRLISIGSDDAIKIWLNGKKIHEDWVGRSVRPDEDFLLAEFLPGKNSLMAMVQNFGGPWGLAIEIPDAKSLNQMMRQVVISGDVEKARILLQAGADPNGDCLYGFLNHTEAARFMRRQNLTKVLQENGGKVRWYNPIWYPWLVSRIAPIIAQRDSRPQPGVSLLVAQRGKTLMELCWGMANIETGSRITPETKFPIGSITKQFAAAAVLQLQEEGKLCLTNRLSEYFPSFPRADQIRLRQLLDHTSGIFNYTSQSDFRTRCLTRATESDVLKYIQNWPFGDYPGRRFEYSNSNHYLAGLIVEKASGQKLADYFSKRIFEPLGMRQTSLGEGERVIPGMATGYSGKAGQVRRANMWNFAWAAGAGGIVSTPRDMNLWMEGLYGGKVLKPESLKEMLRIEPTPFSEFAQSPDGYACGVFVDSEAGRTLISHTGYLPPYCASATRLEELKVNVIILSNGDHGFKVLNTDWLQAGLLSLFFHKEMGPSQRDLEGPPLPPDQVAQFVGNYDDGATIFKIKKQGHRWLFAGPDGHENLRLTDEHKWVCRECGKSVIAIRKGQDDVMGIEIKKGLHTSFAVKKKEWNPEEMQNLQRLPDYPGKYQIERGLGFLEIKFEKGSLVGDWPPGGSPVRLDHIGPDEFTAPNGNIRIHFERDPSGRVYRLISRYSGYTWELPKQVPQEVSGKVPEVIK